MAKEIKTFEILEKYDNGSYMLIKVWNLKKIEDMLGEEIILNKTYFRIIRVSKELTLNKEGKVSTAHKLIVVRDCIKEYLDQFISLLEERDIKGFDYRDLLSLDVTIATWILPRLIQFKKDSHFVDDIGIDKMIAAFQIIAEGKQIPTPDKETKKIMNEGLQAFADNLPGLWY